MLRVKGHDEDLYWLKLLLPYSKKLIWLCEEQFHLLEHVTWVFEVCSTSETVKQFIEDMVKAVPLYHSCQGKQEMSYMNTRKDTCEYTKSSAK